MPREKCLSLKAEERSQLIKHFEGVSYFKNEQDLDYCVDLF